MGNPNIIHCSVKYIRIMKAFFFFLHLQQLTDFTMDLDRTFTFLVGYKTKCKSAYTRVTAMAFLVHNVSMETQGGKNKIGVKSEAKHYHFRCIIY